MTRSPFHELSKRERQVMDIVLRNGEVTVREVFEGMSDAPSYNAVRATMNVLVDKGHLRFRREGKRFVYRVARSKDRTRARALQHLVTNLFDGSTTSVVSTLLAMKREKLSDADYRELSKLIQAARRGKAE